MKLPVKQCLYMLAILMLVLSCKEGTRTDEQSDSAEIAIKKPQFSADSAYAYLEQQVAFGPRVPGTPSQKQCAAWMANTLRRFGWDIIIQETKVTLYNNKEVPCINIIGSINPGAEKRLLLCAHWDTRPFADQYSPDPYAKMDGADDGASGVGVLLEIARQLQQYPIKLGVDILLVDVEDWGEHASERTDNRDTYCLGTQYWARNPHKPGYTADNGILLDLVGAKGALFGLEGTSMRFAPDFMRIVWDAANALGHGSYFSYEQQPDVIDDHVYINKLAGIPTINIINYGSQYEKGFPPHWHTPDDNMAIIDRNTLQAVGETVLSVINAYK